MPRTRRTQLLMEPADFKQLQAVARQRKVSVAELIRQAVRQTYLSSSSDRSRLVEEINAMGLSVNAWGRAKKDIEESHAGSS